LTNYQVFQHNLCILPVKSYFKFKSYFIKDLDWAWSPKTSGFQQEGLSKLLYPKYHILY